MTRRLSGKGACRGLGAALSMAAVVWGPPFLSATHRPPRTLTLGEPCGAQALQADVLAGEEAAGQLVLLA